jgi:hypothetical protein
MIDRVLGFQDSRVQVKREKGIKKQQAQRIRERNVVMYYLNP